MERALLGRAPMRRLGSCLSALVLFACAPAGVPGDASPLDASPRDAGVGDGGARGDDAGADAPASDAGSDLAASISSPIAIEDLDYGAFDAAVLGPTTVLAAIVVGASIELVGEAHGGTPPYSLAWRSSLDGALGSGARLTITPSAGDHDLTLEATDAAGHVATSAIRPLHVLPATFDWSHVRRPSAPPAAGNWMTPVRSQGRCGSCWAMAAMAVMEAQINIDHAMPDLDVDLSEQTTIDCDMHSIGCSGGATEQSLSGYLHDVGAETEICNPFLGTDDTCIDTCRDGSTPARYRVDGTLAVIGDGGANDAVRAWMRYQLVHHGPIARTIIDMYGYDGATHLCAPLGGDHYVAVVGYDDAARVWIAKNSWGATWNGDGYMEVAYGNCAIDASATIVTHVTEP